MSEEILKQIKGYEGIYSVSNYGRVFSHRKNRFIKPTTNGTKYLQVDLCVNQKHKYPYVHRLVAEAFIQNSNNYKFINHKDENPTNNNADNLEWCTFEYNLRYGTRIERISEMNRKRCSKALNQYDMDGNYIRTFESVSQAEREFGYNHCGIILCIKGKINHAYGYKWRYVL